MFLNSTYTHAQPLYDRHVLDNFRGIINQTAIIHLFMLLSSGIPCVEQSFSLVHVTDSRARVIHTGETAKNRSPQIAESAFLLPIILFDYFVLFGYLFAVI